MAVLVRCRAGVVLAFVVMRFGRGRLGLGVGGHGKDGGGGQGEAEFGEQVAAGDAQRKLQDWQDGGTAGSDGRDTTRPNRPICFTEFPMEFRNRFVARASLFRSEEAQFTQLPLQRRGQAVVTDGGDCRPEILGRILGGEIAPALERLDDPAATGTSAGSRNSPAQAVPSSQRSSAMPTMRCRITSAPETTQYIEPPSRISVVRRGMLRVRCLSGGSAAARSAWKACRCALSRMPTASFIRCSMLGTCGRRCGFGRAMPSCRAVMAWLYQPFTRVQVAMTVSVPSTT